MLLNVIQLWKPRWATWILATIATGVFINTAIHFQSLSFTSNQLASITNAVVGKFDFINAMVRAFHHESIWHLLGNLIGIFFIGGFLERQIGSIALFITFLGGAAIAGFSAVIHQYNVCVGLSGAIYALSFVHAYLNKYVGSLLLMLAVEVVLISILKYPVDIANHVLGACYGWLFGMFYLNNK